MKRRFVVKPKMIKASTDKVVSRDTLINLFKQLELTDSAVCHVNDSDPMWTLDTPDLFANACVDHMYSSVSDFNEDYHDEIIEAIGRPLTTKDIECIEDWIYDECSQGDFGY